MSFDKNHFLSLMPKGWKSVDEVLSRNSFIPIVVGGIVRDYLLKGTVGKDWDIELTHPTVTYSKNLWKQLGKELQSLGRTTFLPYDIIRLELGNQEYEFSPPRVETFNDSDSHKNFSAEFDFSAPFEQSILRRDFTINAIGIRFDAINKIELLDPVKGVSHLKDKVLHSCGPDFIKDPVRFLRAIRFSIKLGFILAPELKTKMEAMKASGFTPSYLWSEMQKSAAPLEFYLELLSWLQFHPDLKLPIGAELQNKVDDLKLILLNQDQHECWIIALAWVGLPSESWQTYFSLSSESSKRLSRWAESSKKFTKMMPKIFHGEFEQVKEMEDFTLVFDWYFTTKQLLQKNTNLPLLEMIEKYLTAWIHLFRFDVVKDVKHIEPPLRAKYQVWNLCQRL